eukprot:gene17962-biopygen18923
MKSTTIHTSEHSHAGVAPYPHLRGTRHARCSPPTRSAGCGGRTGGPVLSRAAPCCSVLLRAAPCCSVLLRAAPCCAVLFRKSLYGASRSMVQVALWCKSLYGASRVHSLWCKPCALSTVQVVSTPLSMVHVVSTLYGASRVHALCKSCPLSMVQAVSHRLHHVPRILDIPNGPAQQRHFPSLRAAPAVRPPILVAGAWGTGLPSSRFPPAGLPGPAAPRRRGLLRRRQIPQLVLQFLSGPKCPRMLSPVSQLKLNAISSF